MIRCYIKFCKVHTRCAKINIKVLPNFMLLLHQPAAGSHSLIVIHPKRRLKPLLRENKMKTQSRRIEENRVNNNIKNNYRSTLNNNRNINRSESAMIPIIICYIILISAKDL